MRLCATQVCPHYSYTQHDKDLYIRLFLEAVIQQVLLQIIY